MPFKHNIISSYGSVVLISTRGVLCFSGQPEGAKSATANVNAEIINKKYTISGKLYCMSLGQDHFCILCFPPCLTILQIQVF